MVSDVSMTCLVPQLTTTAPFVQTKVQEKTMSSYISVRQTYFLIIYNILVCLCCKRCFCGSFDHTETTYYKSHCLNTV